MFIEILERSDALIYSYFYYILKQKKNILFILLFGFIGLQSQNPNKKAILQSLKTAITDTNKVNSLNTLGRNYIIEGEYILADSVLTIALKLSKQLNFKLGEVNALTNTGVLYWYQDDYPKALDYYFEALKLNEVMGNKKLLARSLTNIGLVYSSLNENPKALDYYTKALNIKKEIQDKKGSAIILGNIGEIHKKSGNYSKALTCFLDAQKVAEDLGEQGLISLYIASIGSLYEIQNDYSHALENYLNALTIAEKINDKVLLSSISNSIGGIYIKQKNYKEAERYIQNALTFSTLIGDLNNKKDAHLNLSELYSLQNKWQFALENYKNYTSARDSIFNEEKTKKTVRSEMNFAFDKKQTAEKIEQAKKDTIALQKLEQQKMQRNYFIIGFVLMILIALLIFRSYRQKQKANVVIALQKAEVEKQKDLIEEKSKEITDSIVYAKRLQDAILPPESYINTFLPENFVFYKPKDIVAGDFYWMEHKDDITYLAVADCTGHGVPGAMVSVICSNALNRTVLEFGISDPGKILDKTRDLVLETFSKSDKDVKDGMDISLCTIKSSGEVRWAGAYNPLWYVSKGLLIELTADKQPIGKTEKQIPFKTHSIQLNKGDILFLFTDGYADQFGGGKGKKFKYKPLKELIMKNVNLSTAEQKTELEYAFNIWKGNLEQVDDVCIIGVRL